MKFAKVTAVLFVVILAISMYFSISLIKSFSPDVADRSMNKWIDILLIWTYILLAISCFTTLVLEFAHTIHDKKKLRKSLIIIGSLALVFLVSYLFSDNEIPSFKGAERFIANGTLTPAISHFISTCLYSAYFLMAIAIIGIVYSYIRQLLN